MSNKVYLLLFLLQYSIIAHGQTFFSIIPELESIEGQGSCRILFPSDSNFIIFGHRYDTSYDGSNAKPWFGQFTLDGQMEVQYSLRDESYESTFNASRLNFAKKKNIVWFGYSGRFINSNSTPYIYKFNIQTGEIISSKLLPNLEYPNSNISPDKIIFHADTISLLSYQQDLDSTRLYITELDTLFNIIREFRIESAARKHFPKYFSRNTDGSYLLISDSKRPIPDNLNSNNISFMHIAANGKIIDFNWSPASIPISNGLVQAKNVIKNGNGDWIILGHHIIFHTDSCLFCAIQIPYILSVTKTFDTLLWQTRFYDIPYLAAPHFDVFAITQVSDGYVGAGELQGNLLEYPPSGILFKTNLNGDSLWMKHYIPLGWNKNRVGIAKFFDIKTSSSNNIIVAGEVSDDSLDILLPWILHLDKDGCLVPGCNLINSSEEDVQANIKEDHFGIFPNPAAEEIYLLSRKSSSEEILVQLVSNAGTIMKKTLFVPEKGFQYTLPLDKIHPGMYHLIFTDQKTMQSESHTFVKQ